MWISDSVLREVFPVWAWKSMANGLQRWIILFICSHWLQQFMLSSVGDWKISMKPESKEQPAIVDIIANVEMPAHIHVQTLKRNTKTLTILVLPGTQIYLQICGTYLSGLAHNDFLVIPTLAVLLIQKVHNYQRFNDFSLHMQVCGLSDQITCSYF